MSNVQIILNFIDERLKKIQKPDPELVKKHNADSLNKDWQIPEGALWDVERILDTMTVEGWIAIYAAVIATISAAWSIYSILRGKPKLALKANLGFRGSPSGYSPTCLYIEVVNKGRRPITVEGVGLKLDNGQLASYFPYEGELPKELQEEKSFRIGVELEKIRKEIAKLDFDSCFSEIHCLWAFLSINEDVGTTFSLSYHLSP